MQKVRPINATFGQGMGFGALLGTGAFGFVWMFSTPVAVIRGNTAMFTTIVLMILISMALFAFAGFLNKE